MLKTSRTPLPDHILEATLDVWSQTGGQHFIPITGRSMLPLIQEGDQVLVTRGGAGVQPGDVIVFRQKGTLVAHRVMRIQHHKIGQVFVTKGDNVLHFDPPVNADEIVGRVLAIERGHRLMSLATSLWRVVGWLIVVSTLSLAKLYGWGRTLEHRFWGPEPHPLTVFLRRGVLALFSFILRTIQAIACRWKK